MSYSLSPHVSACTTKRYWIVLDTRSDRYFCLDRAHFDPLAASIQGLGAAATDENASGRELPANAAELARSLLERGLLIRCNPGEACARTPQPLTSPNDEIDGEYRRAGERALYLPSFLWACGRADRWLRRRPIDWIVRRVDTDKSRHARRAADFDRARATRLIRVFNAVRPVYPHDYLCMFDSLALLQFLAAHGMHASWVFGVCADPFKAHCWLQSGELLLNDSLPTVSVYTPIMSV